MITIFRKELKDVLRWTPLGMIVIGLLCWRQMPSYLHECSLLSASLAAMAIIGSGLFALVLGLLQSLFDQRTDSRAFLLHRPISVKDIYRGKLAAGFVAHTIAWAVPLLVAAIYLETKGPEKLPVTWSDAIPAALCCLLSFLFHPAGIWMACREARWLGTKWLPLGIPLMACFMAIVTISDPLSWDYAVAATLIVLFSWITLYAARHAFTHQTFLPSSTSEESWSWPNALGLGLGSLVFVVTLMVFVVSSVMTPPWSLSIKDRRLTASADGQLWEIEETWKSPRGNQDAPIHRAGRQLSGDAGPNAAFADLPETWAERSLVQINPSTPRNGASAWNGYRYTGASASADHNGVALFEHNQRLYAYTDIAGWLGTVTPQGVFARNETPQGAFNHLNSLDSFAGSTAYYMSIGGQRLLADSNGIYQLDFDAKKIRRLSETPTQAMAVTLPSDEIPEATFWARDGETLHRYSIKPLTKDQTLPSTDSELVKATHSYPLANVELTATGQWSLDWLADSDSTLLTVAAVDEERVVMTSNASGPTFDYRIADAGGKVQDAGTLPDLLPEEPQGQAPVFVFPPALIVGGTAVLSIVSPDEYRQMTAPILLWFGMGLHALLGGIGAFVLARGRVPGTRQQVVWLVIGLMAGVSAWLAVVAIYPRWVVESCTACQRRRRVDTDRCEHCGAAWEVPDREGIELIGPRDRQPMTSALG